MFGGYFARNPVSRSLYSLITLSYSGVIILEAIDPDLLFAGVIRFDDGRVLVAFYGLEFYVSAPYG